MNTKYDKIFENLKLPTMQIGLKILYHDTNHVCITNSYISIVHNVLVLADRSLHNLHLCTPTELCAYRLHNSK